ncbi:MAG: alpha/beta fold hydrolase [Candidatus Lokiarchaeota archaeon]|nr:alpha/beta fold hydrolase [Candidatus Lokiarchaeota archaeon]
MYLKVDDEVKIYYEDFGNKDAFPIILMHGWGVSSALWSEQIPFLIDEDYRVIILDARGHGKSDNCSIYEDLLQVIQNDVNLLLEHLNINGEYGIIGHSAGGGIAMSLYLSNSENIKFLCLLNSSYRLYEHIDERIFWAFIPDLINVGLHPLFKGPYRLIIRNFIPAIAIVLGKPRKKVKRWVNDILSIKRDVLLKELKHIKKYDLKDDLRKIDVPCLIIAGEYDWLTPPVRSKILHKYIPNSEFHLIKGTGHLSKIEKSNEVNEIILDFIKRVEQSE